MSRLRVILNNPFMVIIPIIIILLFGWYHYSSAEAHINTAENNVLPNSGFDLLGPKGLPADWTVSLGDGGASATHQKGYNSPYSFALTNSRSITKSATLLMSPKVNLKPNESYFYKSFYTSTTPFDLLLRRYYKDGSHDQIIVARYAPSSQWTTASDGFSTASNMAALQVVYSIAAKGTLQVDNTYLEVHPTNVWLTPQPPARPNLIPNSTLASADHHAPNGWSSFTSGAHQVIASYPRDEASSYVRMMVSDYKDGEAKWQYSPLNVTPGQALHIQMSYRSDTFPDVVAEYVMSSGKRKFVTLDTLQPSKDWTIYTKTFEVPPGAVSLFVSGVLHRGGTLDTKDYDLEDVSRSGPLTWTRPVVSLTFDDGWLSAYLNGAPVLNDYGYKGTFYLNPSTIDTTNFMSSDDVASLHTDGHEIASHGYEHLDFTTLDKPSINYQLQRAAQYITQVYGSTAIDFATPFGQQDAQVDYYARQYYVSQRGTESGLNTKQNFDPYNLRVMYMSAQTSKVALAEALSEAKATHGWLILIFHRIDETGKGDATISPSQFRQQVETVKDSGINVIPVAAALQEVKRQE